MTNKGLKYDSWSKTSTQYISRVPDQSGVSWLYNMLEIQHSGLEPSISYLHSTAWQMTKYLLGWLLAFFCYIQKHPNQTSLYGLLKGMTNCYFLHTNAIMHIVWDFNWAAQIHFIFITWDRDVTATIGKARAAFVTLKNIWASGGISMRTKRCIVGQQTHENGTRQASMHMPWIHNHNTQ